LTSAATITELRELDDLHELDELIAAVWERSLIHADTLRALALSGNYVVGARVAGRMVGGLVGWLGGTPPGDLHMHSHILGVLADSQVRGLGFELKQHQRRWCLERGVPSVEWTFDPLVRRNAYFNLTKLGAEASEYLVNFYGPMDDGINAGEESDRLLIRWRLDSKRAEAAAAGLAREPVVEELLGQGAGVVLSVSADGQPVEGSSSTAVVLCQVPDDIVAVRRSDPAVARSWRMAVRRALGGSFATGYRVSGATRTGWFVLER
jgi:predicted GNAT superfamily acetyltransferase